MKAVFLVLAFLLNGIVSFNLFADTRTHSEETKQDIKRMLEDSNQFNKEVADITQGHPKILGMTSEMVLFYTAVALVEAKNCFLKEDPTGCQLFAESLKDPAGHVGFMSFMIAANKSSEWMIYLSKGRLPKYMARNIGMMVGMMVQDTLVEFIRNPKTKELMGLPGDDRYPTLKDKYERAKVLKNGLWKETYGSGDWRADKGIAAISLLAAVALTSGTEYLAKEALIRAIPRIGLELGKKVWIGSRFVRMTTPVGLAVTGIIIFLEWSGFTEKYIAQPMREGYARTQLQVRANHLRLSLVGDQDPKTIEDLSKETSERFAKFRTTILHEPLGIYYGHQKTMSEISQRFFSTTQYTTWLTEGMQKETYTENEGGWHRSDMRDEIYYDRVRFFDGIFCGPSAEDSIKLKLDWHGIALPVVSIPLRATNTFTDDLLRNRGEVRDIEYVPYRVINEPNTCYDSIAAVNTKKYPDGDMSDGDNVYCPVQKQDGYWRTGKFWYINYWGCKFMVQQYREHLLYKTQGQDQAFADQLALGNLNAMTTLLSRTQVLRLALIKRYEKTVRKSLLSGMSGREVTISGDTSPAVMGSNNSSVMVLESYVVKGAIPVLEEEISFWNSMVEKGKNESIKTILRKYREIAVKQKEYAEELVEFMKKPFSARDRSEDIDLMFSQEDWAQLAKFYKQFILN